MKISRGFAGLRYEISRKEGSADKVLLTSYVVISLALWLSTISVVTFYSKGWVVPILSFVVVACSFFTAYKLDDRFGLETFTVSTRGIHLWIIICMSITQVSLGFFGALIFGLYILPKLLG